MISSHTRRLSVLHHLTVALASLFYRKSDREDCWNEASTTGIHPNGCVPFVAEVAITQRHLLVQKGTAADGIILNIATTRPWGVCSDEPANGAGANVRLLGSFPGTILMRASKAIATGSKVWTAAGGKITDTYAAGAFFLGRAVTSAGADNDLVEVQHFFPMLDASGTTL